MTIDWVSLLVVAAVCLLATVAIVGYGLYMIVA